MFLLFVHLQGAQIDHLFLRGESKSSVSERNNPNGDQDDANNAGGLHATRFDGPGSD